MLSNNYISKYTNSIIPQNINNLLDEVELLYHTNDSDRLYYHNFKHTKQVVQRILFLYKYYGYNNVITEEELNYILIAGVFHDIGYIFTSDASVHEEYSATYFRDNYSDRFNKEETSKIVSYITSTKINIPPTNIGEKLIRDADTLNWSMVLDDFLLHTIEVLKEIEYNGEYDLYLDGCLDLYLTKYNFEGYGSDELNNLKMVNINHLRETIKYIRGEESIFDNIIYNYIDYEYVIKSKRKYDRI